MTCQAGGSWCMVREGAYEHKDNQGSLYEKEYIRMQSAMP